MNDLQVYVKEGLPFARDASQKTSRILTYVFDWLYLIHCLTSVSSIDQPLFCVRFFDVTSSNINIDEVLLIIPSTSVFVFGDFNVHHEDWLTYSGGTGRPGKICYNFSISNDLTQMINFQTRISDCNSRSPLFCIYLFF